MPAVWRVFLPWRYLAGGVFFYVSFAVHEKTNNKQNLEDALRNTVILFAVAALALSASADALARKNYSVKDVKGRYAFSFHGEIVGGSPLDGPVAASGYLIADGKGNITEGKRTTSTILGIFPDETFTCMLTVEPDGMGSATCSWYDPPEGFPDPETFDFVLDNNAKAFHFVGTTTNTVVVGSGSR